MADDAMVLWLMEDVLEPGGETVRLTEGNRMIYVHAGRVAFSGREYIEDRGWFAAASRRVGANRLGATLWRWELLPEAAPAPLAEGDGLTSRELLHAPLGPLAAAEGLIMRLDSVAFPPGSRAHLHTHPGPGIRVLREGAIRIDSEGKSTDYAPGEAWFEAAAEPVVAQADETLPTRFIRVMILPLAMKGRTTIRYLRPEDEDKPRLQKYLVYRDQVIEV